MTFGKSMLRLVMTWAEAFVWVFLPNILSIIFMKQVVFTALHRNRKAVGHFNCWCPQSIAFGVLGEIQQGQAKKSLNTFF